MSRSTYDALRDLFVAILFATATVAAWHWSVPWIAQWALVGR
jgi:hypothetical protein